MAFPGNAEAIFAIVLGARVLVPPHVGHDANFPAAATEGPPGTTLGAGDDGFAHARNLSLPSVPP
jgi:hypothetical protein